MVNIVKVGIGFVNALRAGVKSASKKVPKKSNLFSLSSEKLIPGAKKHSLFTQAGELADEGVALVHMTNYFPKSGSLLSDRAAFSGTRNSVHFAVNHAVGDVNGGANSWKDRRFGIIIPFKEIVNCNKKGKFQAGLACDLWTDGSLRLPKGTIIVRQSKRVPKGKLRVRNAEQIERFKHLKGVKIVETSELPHSQISTILKKSGFQSIDSSSEVLGGFGASRKKLLDEMKIWNKFAKRHGIIPAIHMYTPNAALENLVEVLKSENIDPLKLLIKNANNEVIDFKAILINYIKSLKEQSSRMNLPITTFDTNILEDIIKNANKFEDIRKGITKRLKLKKIFNAGDMIKYPITYKDLGMSLNLNLGIHGNPEIMSTTYKVLNHPDSTSLEFAELFKSVKILETIKKPVKSGLLDETVAYAKKQYKSFLEKEFARYKKATGMDPLQGKTLVFV